MGLPVGLVGSVPAGTAAAPVGPTRPVAGSAGPATPGPVAAYTPYAGAAAAPGAAPWVPVASDAAAGAPSRAPWESAAAGTASGASGPVLASTPAGGSGAPAADPAPGPAGAPSGAPWESAAPDPAGAAWESAVSAVVTASVASDATSDPASVAAGPATCLVSRVLPAGLSAGVVPAGTAGSADGESGVVVMGAVCQTRAALIHALRPGAGPRPAQGPVAGKAGHATNDHRPRIHQQTLRTARVWGFATGPGSTRGLAPCGPPRRQAPGPRGTREASRPSPLAQGPGSRARESASSANILTMLPTGGVGQPIGSQ